MFESNACNNNFKMLKYLRDNYEGGVHISFGMTTKLEEEEIGDFKGIQVNPNAQEYEEEYTKHKKKLYLTHLKKMQEKENKA